MVKPHKSDIPMTYEYIRVTYGWYTSTCEWHMDDIQVHTSDVRMTYEYIQVTFGWHTSRVHTSDIQMACEWHKKF